MLRQWINIDQNLGNNGGTITLKYPIGFNNQMLLPLLSSTRGMVSGLDTIEGMYIKDSTKTSVTVYSDWETYINQPLHLLIIGH